MVFVKHLPTNETPDPRSAFPCTCLPEKTLKSPHATVSTTHDKSQTTGKSLLEPSLNQSLVSLIERKQIVCILHQQP